MLTKEEQDVLREAVRACLADAGQMPNGAWAEDEAGVLRAAWSKLLEVGVVALDTGVDGVAAGPGAGGPDLADGELAMGAAELQLVLEELGHADAALPLADAWLAQRLLAPWAGRQPAVAAWLRELRQGRAIVAVVLGHHDGDAAAGDFVADGGAISGTMAAWQGSPLTSHLLVALREPGGWALVERQAPGVSCEAVPAFGKPALARLELRLAPAVWVAQAGGTPGSDTGRGDAGSGGGSEEGRGGAGAWRGAPGGGDMAHHAEGDGERHGGHRQDDVALLAQWAALAQAHGSARRVFSLVLEYARERRQFGQPIGRFQAIQHKLVDVHMGLEGVRLLLSRAAQALDEGSPLADYHLACAATFAVPALKQASLQIQHTFGAIGYAEEHEAPRHFRQIHRLCTAHGGVMRARRRLAGAVFARPGFRFPELDLGERGNAFRQEVRQWLAGYWTAERRAAFEARPFHDREYDPEFALALGATGWNGLAWPEVHGGQGRSPQEQIAFIEEMERAEAPRAGAAVQANALMLYGTPEQQARYLPEMLRGEAMHGMGYSEPQAGSDLAALRTRAERDGEGWRIQGQKIWTTTWWGKYMFLAARTDPEAKPAHAGISMFIVPMDAPGISIHPATTMYDGSFANIFYDDVRLPADALVGEVNGGWKVLTGALAAERGLIGGGIVCKVMRWYEQALDILGQDAGAGSLEASATTHAATTGGQPANGIAEAWHDPLVRDRLASFAAEIEAGRLLMLHCAELAVDGVTPPEAGAISKVFSGELMERFGEALLEILGLRATLSQGAPGAWANGSFEQRLRHSLMWVISIGTNEIQRSLIAQRGLGLPR